MDNNSKEGFSYQSPEKKKKDAARLFVIEVAILVIIVTGIFAALAYLGVIRLPFLPDGGSKTISDSGRGRTQLQVDNNTNATVRVDSQIQGVKLSVVNTNKLIELLKNMNVFGRRYAPQGSNSQPVATNLNITLVDTEQTEHSVSTVGQGILYGTKTTFEGEDINMLIYLGDFALNDEGRSARDKGMLVQEAVVRALYAYANTVLTQDEIYNNPIEILRNLNGQDKIYFLVE